jgi:hypothetical protein
VNERKRASESCGNHGSECESLSEHSESGNGVEGDANVVVRWGQTDEGLD